MRKATEIQHDLRLLCVRNMYGLATELFYETENAARKMMKKYNTELQFYKFFDELLQASNSLKREFFFQ